MKAYGGQHGIAVAYTPNVTIGINVMANFAGVIANCLPHFDYQITEMHHNKKRTPFPAPPINRRYLLAKLPEDKERIPINAARAGGYGLS